MAKRVREVSKVERLLERYGEAVMMGSLSAVAASVLLPGAGAWALALASFVITGFLYEGKHKLLAMSVAAIMSWIIARGE